MEKLIFKRHENKSDFFLELFIAKKWKVNHKVFTIFTPKSHNVEKGQRVKRLFCQRVDSNGRKVTSQTAPVFSHYSYSVLVLSEELLSQRFSTTDPNYFDFKMTAQKEKLIHSTFTNVAQVAVSTEAD